MPSRVWLHIGSEKTGTSSIQAFLARNRDALAARGFIVPAAAGHGNQVALAAYAVGPRAVKELYLFGLHHKDEVGPFQERLERELLAETAEAPGSDVIFSSELLSYSLRDRAEVDRLKQLCDRIAPQTKIIIYLRNQIDQLTSWYSTVIKGGGTKAFPWPPGPIGDHMLDYQAKLGLWADVFGRENIVARRFVSSDFTGGDVINDFSEVIGIDTEGLQRPPRVNSALDVDCLAFLRQFNKHVPRRRDRELNPSRGRIVALLEKLSGSEKHVVSPRIADDIRNAYQESNAAVSRDYFAGRHDPLFPPAKSVGATDADGELRNDPAAFARIAAALWSDNVEQIATLEHKLKTSRQKLRALRQRAGKHQAKQ